jgi:peroxiredoxin Q/BCP
LEGCGFRDLQSEYDALGIQIVGVSFAEPETNMSWVEDQSYEFEIWTDDERALALYYGAIDDAEDLAPKRHTKILDASGTLVLEYVDSVGPDAHPQQVLEDCQALFGG